MEDFERPCYVISCNGMRESISYEDGYCYGPSRHLATTGAHDARDIIKADIRQAPDERNGLPLYWISDHGNVNRRRRVTLRKV